jgi:hypothetical protein
MKNTIALLAAVVALPIGALAAPSLTITSPKQNASLTNGVLTASGTAVGNPSITNVFYSFNGSGFAPVTAGATNWSVVNLHLTAGSNTFSAYAVDRAGAHSKTNQVTFTYVVQAPLTVSISPSAAWGSVSLTNGELLQIGKQYTLSAKAASGFKFSAWNCDGTNLPGSSASIKFTMVSNLVFVAAFQDVTLPLCVITSPAVGHTVTNSFVATFRATDKLVGVGAVFYQFNGSGWILAGASGATSTWQSASLAVTNGQNTLQAWATNTAGLASTTNTVLFKGVLNTPAVTGLAPASLAGLAAIVTNSDDSVSEVSFGVATYAVSPLSTNDSPKAGNYTYTVLSTNSALMTTFVVSPPDKAGQMDGKYWTFTSTNVCTTTNTDSGEPLTIALFPASNLVPSGSEIITSSYVDGIGVKGTNVFDEGVFTNYSTVGTFWGVYHVYQFSPIVAVEESSYTDPVLGGFTDYSQLTYSTQGAGTYYRSRFHGSNNLVGENSGTFNHLSASLPATGYAPTTLAGQTCKLTPKNGSVFYATFGDDTYSVFDSNTNDQNSAVGDYGYTKTGPDTGELNMITVAPWDNTITNETVGTLTFTSASAGTVLSSGKGGGASFSMSPATDYALASSVVGRTITSSSGGTGTFNDDGTFTWISQGKPSQTSHYSYAQCSPDGGMLFMVHSDGRTSDVQIRFTSSGGGQWYETDFDSNGNFDGISSGTFTLK